MCLPSDVVTSAGAAVPSPLCSLVQFVALLPPEKTPSTQIQAPKVQANMGNVYSAYCVVITDRFTDRHVERGTSYSRSQHFPPTDVSRRAAGCETSLEEHQDDLALLATLKLISRLALLFLQLC